MRARAYGWRGSRLAAKRLKEALSEIKKVYRKDPLTACEGAVLLIKKIVPALEQIDSSSGALGEAVNKVIDETAALIGKTVTPLDVRKNWLEKIWEAYQDDGYGYLDIMGEQWDRLCGLGEKYEEDSRVIANEWADRMYDVTVTSWSEKMRAYFRGSVVCLASLLRAGRYQELFELLEKEPYKMWFFRKFGARALVEMGKYDAAIAYAEDTRGLNQSDMAIDVFCEESLLSQKRYDEAYAEYAFTANRKTTYLATCKAIVMKYPVKQPEDILKNLVESSIPDERGKWFAAAKSLGMLDVASFLAKGYPCEPKTLIRAGQDFLETKPYFSFITGTSALQWIAQGYGYEIGYSDVAGAWQVALKAAKQLDRISEFKEKINALLNDNQTDTFVKNYLQREIGQLV